MLDHDFQRFPELSNAQLSQFYFDSPHRQILEDFEARVLKVHDGDTFTCQWRGRDLPVRVRLAGIDTKELSEGGQEAEEWLRNRIEGKNVSIILDKNRVGKFGRILGTIIEGLDVNQELLANGLALPFGSKNEGKILSPVKDINTFVGEFA